jgi:hypothetical protein
MTTFLRYVSVLLGAVGVIFMVLATISYAPGVVANEVLDGECHCPNGGDGLCVGVEYAQCQGDDCDCCICELPIVCEWDFDCNEASGRSAP